MTEEDIRRAVDDLAGRIAIPPREVVVRRHRKRQVLTGLAAAVVALAVVAGSAAVLSTNDNAVLSPTDDGVDPSPTATFLIGGLRLPVPAHCIGGEPSSLEEATRLAGFPIFTPDHELAGPTTLESVWLCPGAVSLLYASGVAVHMMPSQMDDPGKTFQRIAADSTNASVLSVHGQPALAGPPNPAIGAQGGVEFVEEGVHLTVTNRSATTSLDDFLAIAETLTPLAIHHSCPTPQPESSEEGTIADYSDWLIFDGRRYEAFDQPPRTSPPTPGQRVGGVTCQISKAGYLPDYRPQDGDASLLQPGLPLYAAKGWPVRCRILAQPEDEYLVYTAIEPDPPVRPEADCPVR